MKIFTDIYKYIISHTSDESRAYIKKHKIDLNEEDKDGNNILFLMMCFSAVSPVNLVNTLEDIGGVNWNVVFENGQTPAHMAASQLNSSKTALRALVKIEGIDWNKADSKGQTPAHILLQFNEVNVVSRLGKKGQIDWSKLGSDDCATVLRSSKSSRLKRSISKAHGQAIHTKSDASSNGSELYKSKSGMFARRHISSKNSESVDLVSKPIHSGPRR